MIEKNVHIPRELFVAAYRRSCEKDPEAIRNRAEIARKMLESCTVCPHKCQVNRLENDISTCHTGRFAKVSNAIAHKGEERGISGWNGSGTIFFSSCNLRCVFCQNYNLSRGREGRIMDSTELANVMLNLQDAGCHNINFVTPSHVIPQILEALALAADEGLFIPLVYNTSAYDSVESIRLLDGIVDIYMPDLKFMDPERARAYLVVEDYPDIARSAIQEMHRQTGPLCFDGEGLAVRGLLVRHLVMPGNTDDSASVFRFLAEDVSRETWVNIMAQYHPAGKVIRYPDRYGSINRILTREEFDRAVGAARDVGLHRFEELTVS